MGGRAPCVPRAGAARSGLQTRPFGATGWALPSRRASLLAAEEGSFRSAGAPLAPKGTFLWRVRGRPFGGGGFSLAGKEPSFGGKGGPLAGEERSFGGKGGSLAGKERSLRREGGSLAATGALLEPKGDADRPVRRAPRVEGSAARLARLGPHAARADASSPEGARVFENRLRRSLSRAKSVVLNALT